MLVPMQLLCSIELNNGDELIHKANAADNVRVNVNRFFLWIPRLTLKDIMYGKFVSSFLKETQWTYTSEMYEVSGPTTASGFFQIPASIDDVNHSFVYLKKSCRNANGSRQAENSPYTMNTYSLDGGATLSTRKLEYSNGIFHPEKEYDSETKVRIFNDLMAYAMTKKSL